MLGAASHRITCGAASLMASHPPSEDQGSDVSSGRENLSECRHESGSPVKDFHPLESLRHDTVFGSCRLQQWVMPRSTCLRTTAGLWEPLPSQTEISRIQYHAVEAFHPHW